MVVETLAVAGLTNYILGRLLRGVIDIGGRIFAIAWAHALAMGMLENYTDPRKVISMILPKWTREKYLEEVEKNEKLRGVEDFLSFLREFNTTFARYNIASSILGPEASFAASQIASAYQWSYGLGWLSWIGTGQLLQNLVAQPVEQELNKLMRHKLLSESAAKELWTLGLIDDNTFYEHLAALGYSDDKIEAIKKALIDDLIGGKVARLLRKGIIKEEDVLNKLKGLGVPEDLANLVIDSMYNVPSDSVIVKLFKAGKIDRETALRLLRMNGYKREWAEWILEASKEERVEKDKDLSKSEVMRLRRYGIIDDDTFTTFMKALGYDETEADYLLKLTKATIPTQDPPKPKTLTKDNILRAFELGVIREDEARKMLKALRYDDTSINILIELSKIRMNKEPEELKRDLTKGDILRALRLGLITREQADAYLTALGYDEKERAILIQFADIREQRRRVRKTLPASVIARAFQLKIIDAMTFETYLRLLGYGDIEIMILKKLYAPKAS
jgi:hypothetical protein